VGGKVATVNMSQTTKLWLVAKAAGGGLYRILEDGHVLFVVRVL